MAIFDTLVAVIPMLGILIVVHELGHFLVAKACGVRVLKFSIGFGSPIGFGRMRMRWERNGTEYVIGWIPLGGFVRMLGEPMPGDEDFAPPVPEDARPDEFLEAKPVWQKLAVVFAGPAMNMVLPIVCLLGILWVGFPRLDSVVGMVEADSPAARAGIEVGDRILTVDGQPVDWWDEAIVPIQERTSGGTLALEIEREDERLILEVPVATQKTRDRFGAFVDTGWIGINNRRLAALVGVPSAESAAARAGLRSGDLVLAVGEDVDPARVGLAEGNQRETDLEDWEALRAAHGAAVAQAQSDGRSVVMWQIERQTGELGLAADPAAEPGAARPPPEILTVALPARADLESLGLMPATILVGYVSPDKPAAKAGLAAGDLVLAVDGQEIGSFGSFVSLIQTSGGRELAVTYSRAGQVDTVQLAAQEETVAGLYEIEGMEEKIFQIGLGAAVSSLPGARGYHKVRNPAESVPRAFQMAWGMTTAYLEGLGKFFTGEVGTDKLSGPIGIARIARKSLDRGWLDYLQMMMLISINLAILNLLPIPILDGGQALIYSIEGIKRSPLSLRTREMATSVGFAMLVLLMGRAFWNDLTPFWMRFVDWLSSGPQ